MSYLTRQKFPVPLNRDQVAQDWGRRGYSCDVFTNPPGREWNDFVHATNELVIVMEGKLKLTIGWRRDPRRVGRRSVYSERCLPFRQEYFLHYDLLAVWLRLDLTYYGTGRLTSIFGLTNSAMFLVS